MPKINTYIILFAFFSILCLAFACKQNKQEKAANIELKASTPQAEKPKVRFEDPKAQEFYERALKDTSVKAKKPELKIMAVQAKDALNRQFCDCLKEGDAVKKSICEAKLKDTFEKLKNASSNKDAKFEDFYKAMTLNCK